MLPKPAGEADAALAELSGAWFDPAADVVLVVTDQRERPSLLTMRVRAEPDVHLELVSTVGVARAAPVQSLDLEGIAPDPAGDLFLASEGEALSAERASPGIFRYSRDGRFTGRVELPPAYAGLRPNQGFEGLTTSPDGRRLFAATESSLVQDGPTADVQRGALTRVLMYETERLTSPREYAYRTQPVPPLPGAASPLGDNGVSEVLALGGDDLLILERAFVRDEDNEELGRNVVRLFRVRVDPAADVTGRWSLMDEPPPVVLEKRLVFDLDSVVDRLPQALRHLDNFEALSFGPRLADGRRTLLMISDDNRGDRQVSALVVLAIAAGDPLAAITGP